MILRASSRRECLVPPTLTIYTAISDEFIINVKEQADIISYLVKMIRTGRRSQTSRRCVIQIPKSVTLTAQPRLGYCFNNFFKHFFLLLSFIILDCNFSWLNVFQFGFRTTTKVPVMAVASNFCTQCQPVSFTNTVQFDSSVDPWLPPLASNNNIGLVRRALAIASRRCV